MFLRVVAITSAPVEGIYFSHDGSEKCHYEGPISSLEEHELHCDCELPVYYSKRWNRK